MEVKLVAALDAALEQWRVYSNSHRMVEGHLFIEDSKDAEAELYRMCADVLENAKDKA